MSIGDSADNARFWPDPSVAVETKKPVLVEYKMIPAMPPAMIDIPTIIITPCEAHNFARYCCMKTL